MEEIIESLGDGYICAGQRGPYDDPGAAGYAFYAELGASDARDLGKLIRLDSEKCRLFACDGLVVTTSPRRGAGQVIQLVEPNPARVRATLTANLFKHGFLLGVDRAATCGLFWDTTNMSVRRLEKSLPALASSVATADPHAEFVASTDDGWVVTNRSIDARRERRTLMVLDGHGQTVREHKLPGTLSQVAMSANGTLAICALIGGEVDRVDLASGEIRRFKPHLEAKKEDWPEIVVDPAGAYFLSWITTGSINRTDLETGETAPLLELSLETREVASTSKGWFGMAKPKARREVYIPDFALHQGHLLTLRARTVSDEGDPRSLSMGETFSSEIRAGGPRPFKYSPRRSLEDNLGRAGLSGHQEVIGASWWPAIALAAKRVPKLALGQSRLGGQPDCPHDFEWPSYAAAPMAFLAQLYLTDTAPHAAPGLPDRGWLLVFFALDEHGWPVAMSAPTDAAGHFEMLRIIHVEAEMELASYPLPDALSEAQRLEPCGLRPARGPNALPADDSAAVRSWGLGAKEMAAYVALAAQVNRDAEDDDDAGLQLAGYPTVMQSNTMEYEAEAAVRGRDPHAIHADISAADAARWRLLLQIPSHEPSGVDWVELSALYLWIRSDHLGALDFNRVYMTMQ